MKRLSLLFIMVACTLQCANAQSLTDALKNVVTSAADKVTGGKVTQAAMVGEWTYKAPAVKFKSDNAATELAATAATSTIQTKLEKAYTMAGIKAGTCKCTFGSDRSFTMTLASRTLAGTYTFDGTTNALTMTFTSAVLAKMGAMHGYAYLSGSDLQILFPADKVMTLVKSIGSKAATFSSSLASLSTVLNKFDGMNLGFDLTK